MSDLDLDDPGTEIESVTFGPADDEDLPVLPEMSGFLEELGVVPEEMDKTLKFFELRITGVEPALAALEVGWSMKKLREKERDPYFHEIMAEIRTCTVESLEAVLIRKARAGSMDALKMCLYNMAPEKWKDVRRIIDERTGEPIEKIAASVTTGVLDALRQAGVRQMQQAYVPHAIEATVAGDADRSETS